MSLLTAGIVTGSELTVRRAPIDFLEIELAVLAEMGLRYQLSAEYLADNGHTRLADITISPSTLKAPIDKIHPMPFPGLNIDNLPFFAVIAATGRGLDADPRLGLRQPGDPPLGPDPAGRRRPAAGPAPRAGQRADALVERRGGLPAGAAPRGLHPAGDARGEGHLGAAQRRHHRPRLRAPLRAAGRDGRRASRSSATEERPRPDHREWLPTAGEGDRSPMACAGLSAPGRWGGPGSR